jgi:hypothetical protein
MKEYMDELAKVRSQCLSLGDALAKKHKLSLQEPPLEALPISFNFATLGLELTSHYDKAWGTHPVTGLSAERIAILRDENAQRLVMLSKTVFTWSLSGMEYAAKRALAKYPSVIPLKKKKGARIYLRDIIEASGDAGLIEAAKRPLWLGANTIRNKVVHNNGVGEGNAKWEFSKGLSLTMEDGKMLQGTMMTFPFLLGWIVAEYADWCDRFLGRANPS